ncbi:MAG: HAD hydrolase family protein [Candidatus Marinimicrobia bacterium]|nr:HAD hydrolase family protein [Candidatus Neomarinimicrobiota bacterium]
MIDKTIKNRLKRIKLVISDVDGVLTDGGIYISKEQELKKFCPADGLGIALLRAAGIAFAMISGRKSEATEKWAKELDLEDVLFQTPKKIIVYEELKKRFCCSDEEIAYIGDDLIDWLPMQKAGIKIAPLNARKEIKKIADYITPNPGGDCGFRDAIDFILYGAGRFEDALQKIMKEKYGAE